MSSKSQLPLARFNNYHQLISTTLNFTKKEIKTRYAEALIGSLWVVVYPFVFSLLTVLVFSFVFRGRSEQAPYFLYVLIGFNSWFWFSQTIVYSTRSLVNNRELILNNKFPTESIIFSIAVTKIIDHIINIVLIYILLILFHQPIYFSGFLFILLISLIQFVFQVGISLIFSVINVYFRDWQNIIDILLQLTFYATPIIYTLDIVPNQIKSIIQINPMTQIVSAYRAALFQSYIPVNQILLLIALSILFFIISYFIYKRLEHKFAELI